MKRSIAIIAMALLSVGGFFGLSWLNQEVSTPKGFDPDTVPDVIEYTAGVPADTTVALVDGEPVTAESLLYWAGYNVEMMGYYMGGVDWTQQVDGVSLADTIKGQAMEVAKLYRVVTTRGEEMGCGPDEADQAELQAGEALMVEQLGGEHEFDKWLLQVGLTREGFRAINEAQYIYGNVQQALSDQVTVTDQDVQQHIAANDILRAKHILFMTRDATTREPLSEEEQAAKLAAAEEVLAQLNESEDPLALFDELVAAHGEDPGMEANPEGYQFTAGQMVAPFEEGTRALEYNEISGLVESDFGYHIILRLDPATEALEQTVLQEKIAAQADATTTEWMEGAQVELTEAYDSLNVQLYYENIVALRQEIELADAQAETPEE